jgi:hypothetical protein
VIDGGLSRNSIFLESVLRQNAHLVYRSKVKAQQDKVVRREKIALVQISKKKKSYCFSRLLCFKKKQQEASNILLCYQMVGGTLEQCCEFFCKN